MLIACIQVKALRQYSTFYLIVKIKRAMIPTRKFPGGGVTHLNSGML